MLQSGQNINITKTMNIEKHYHDAIIIGGGIAGLFTLAILIENGYNAILLEKSSLGCGQTIKSQGIIHGGTKYALLGKQSNAQKQIADMPNYWRACLSGKGDIDLSDVKLLASHQYMWTENTLSSKVTGFFASNLMKSKVQKLTKDNLPNVLQHPNCKGNIYALDEPVLDIRSLIQSMRRKYGQYIATNTNITAVQNTAVNATVAGKQYTFTAQKIIITAGEGNASLSKLKQQTRPLQMTYVKVPKTYGKLYLHIITTSDKPRLTISSYDYDSQYSIWYLGGDLAEKGSQQDKKTLISCAKKELDTLFSWLTFDDLLFDSFFVDRAEAEQQGIRPDSPVINQQGNIITAWPTKLAMAPILAKEILSHLDKPTIKSAYPEFMPPEISDYPWQLKHL